MNASARRTRTRRGPALFIVGIALAIIGAGCGSSASNPERADPAGGAGDPGQVLPGASAAASAATGSAEAADANDAAGHPGSEPGASYAPGDGSAAQAPADGTLLVKTGTINLRVDELDTAVLKARGAVTALGGYVSDSERRTQGARALASVTYRIPATRWDEALDALRKLAKEVTAEQTKAAEVSAQVVDLGARIDNLRTSEQALRAIMARADKIADILEVQRQLTEVRSQIEQLTAQKEHLQDQAALGTLTALFEEPPVVGPETVKGWDPGGEVQRALGAMVRIGQALGSIAIWLAIVLLPLLLLGGALLAVLVFIVRRIGRRERGLLSRETGP